MELLGRRRNQLIKYSVGDYVLVLPMQKKKIEPALRGPYKVIDHPHDMMYTIQSLVDPTIVMKIHPERMRLFLTNDTTIDDMLKLARFDDHEYVVNAILGHRGTNKKNMLFHVRWEGYGEDQDSEEPYDNLEGCDKLEDYVKLHRELSKILRIKD